MNRNRTLDVAKGIGIILVVLGHNWIIFHEYPEAMRVIFSFHLPLFFFISGIFFKDVPNFKPLLQIKFDGLLKPYFVVLLSLGLAKSLLQGGSFWQLFAGTLYAAGSTIAWLPMWFLPHLFAINLFVWFLLKGMGQRRQDWRINSGIIFIMLVLGTVIFDHFSNRPPSFFHATEPQTFKPEGLPSLPFSLDVLLVTSAFFFTGYCISDRVKNYRFNLALTLIAAILFTALHVFFNVSMDINQRIYGNLWISTVQAATGIYLTLALSERISHFEKIEKMFAFIGQGSLFILIFHFYIQIKVTEVLYAKHLATMFQGSLIGFILSISVSLILFKLVKTSKTLSLLLLPNKKTKLTT